MKIAPDDIPVNQPVMTHAAAKAAGDKLYFTGVRCRMQRDRCAEPSCRRKLRGGGHPDHIVPLSKGGSNDRRNIQWLCAPCNLRKYAKDPIKFAHEMGRLL